MKEWLKHRESLLEVGRAAIALMLVGGLVVLLFGRLKGRAEAAWRRAKRPPAPGTIPPCRHRGVAANPAR